MRFLADMGIPSSAMQWLRAQGHDAVHLGERGLERLGDPDIFALAASEARVLLTVDLDFGEIAANAPASRTTVVLFRLRNSRAANLLSRLAVAIRNAADAMNEAAVIVVEDARIRIRRLH